VTTRQESVRPPAAERELDHLRRLGDELIQRGLRARVCVPCCQRPSLHVTNPELTHLTEDIVAAAGPDGWYFHWSWQEPIGPAEDTAQAADRVLRVLDG
jgi:hypothetical protein